MKRVALILAFGFAAYAAFAQAPFTIVRPADGARVRETVRMLVPKNSVPPGGYIGIFIGGKFVEATVPPVDKTGKYYEYDLDTKGKAIPDGKLTLEAVLYVDYQEKPRIVDRTSVEVTVANTADSKIPEKGLLLRYKWTPGTSTVYDYTERVILDVSDAKKNALGGKPVETSNVLQHFRMLYAVDNAYQDGSGLVRMQALPDKGKDSTFIRTVENPAGQRFYDYEMSPIYMRLSGTGLQVWGSIPFALPLEGTGGEAFISDLFAPYPLPTLPYKPVSIGSSWPSRFQHGSVDLDKLNTLNSVVEHFVARGEFKGVEWEMGHPCAKITNTIGLGETSEESKKLSKANRNFTGNKLQEDETIWFALDRREIIKILRRTSFDVQVSTPSGFGGMPQGGPPSGIPGVPNGANPGAGRNGDEFAPPLSDMQGMTITPGNKGGIGGQGARNGFGRGGGVGAPATTMFVRRTIEQTFILEQ